METPDGVPSPAAVTVPVTLDNNRMFVALTFHRPDGGTRKALAWVNMGMGGLSLAPRLRDELGRDNAISFSVGNMPVVVDQKAVLPASAEDFAQQLGPMPIEAMLPAGVLREFCVVLNYRERFLKLSRSCDPQITGVAVPIQLSEGTGIISVDAQVDEKVYPIVIDSGAGYSWWHGDVVRAWLPSHPDFLRAQGAVGESNQAMVDQAFEQHGTVVRVPTISLGSLQLHDVGILGSGQDGPVSSLVGDVFWRSWGKGAPEPVYGWIGGNVLRDYQLTIDYRKKMTYWARVEAPAMDDLHSVGISLIHTPTSYVVGNLVRKDDAVSIQGVENGDKLVAIDDRETAAMTRGTVLRALHGNPGDHRTLTLERSGKTFQIDGVVGDY